MSLVYLLVLEIKAIACRKCMGNSWEDFPKSKGGTMGGGGDELEYNYGIKYISMRTY